MFDDLEIFSSALETMNNTTISLYAQRSGGIQGSPFLRNNEHRNNLVILVCSMTSRNSWFLQRLRNDEQLNKIVVSRDPGVFMVAPAP